MQDHAAFSDFSPCDFNDLCGRGRGFRDLPRYNVDGGEILTARGLSAAGTGCAHRSVTACLTQSGNRCLATEYSDRGLLVAQTRNPSAPRLTVSGRWGRRGAPTVGRSPTQRRSHAPAKPASPRLALDILNPAKPKRTHSPRFANRRPTSQKTCNYRHLDIPPTHPPDSSASICCNPFSYSVRAVSQRD